MIHDIEHITRYVKIIIIAKMVNCLSYSKHKQFLTYFHVFSSAKNENNENGFQATT